MFLKEYCYLTDTVIRHAKFTVILKQKTNKQIFMILHNENVKQV